MGQEALAGLGVIGRVGMTLLLERLRMRMPIDGKDACYIDANRKYGNMGR